MRVLDRPNRGNYGRARQWFLDAAEPNDPHGKRRPAIEELVSHARSEWWCSFVLALHVADCERAAGRSDTRFWRCLRKSGHVDTETRDAARAWLAGKVGDLHA
jgi:hypothetical protein